MAALYPNRVILSDLWERRPALDYDRGISLYEASTCENVLLPIDRVITLVLGRAGIKFSLHPAEPSRAVPSLSLSLSRESRMDGCPYDFEGDSEVAVYDHVPHARHFPLRDVRMCRTGFLIDLLNRLTDNTERPLDGVRGLLISFKLFEGHICNKSGGGIHGLYHISDISFLVASQRYSTSPRIFADTS